jgi:hypothetical protein
MIRYLLDRIQDLALHLISLDELGAALASLAPDDSGPGWMNSRTQSLAHTSAAAYPCALRHGTVPWM